jgi:multiple sugar transport system substrate-binding protein
MIFNNYLQKWREEKMKRIITLTAVALVVVMAISFSFVSCKTTATETAAATTVAATAATTAAETAAATTAAETTAKTYPKLKFAADKNAWKFDVMFDAFKAKTGIETEISLYSDVETYKAAIKTGSGTEEGFDIFTWWSNFEIMDLQSQGLLEDLTANYAAVEGKYPQGMKDSFSVDGKAYGVPTLVAAWVAFYNVPVFEKYKIAEPKTWDEFIAACETLKSNGVTPIAFTIDGGWTSFIWFQQIFATNYPDAYLQVCLGEKPWTCDEVKETFMIWKDMIDKGYFSDPGLKFDTELPLQMKNGEAGMILIGDWYSDYFIANEIMPGTDYSIFVIPPVNSSLGKTALFEAGPMCVNANSTNKEAAKMFIDYWLSDEGAQLWSDTMGFISSNNAASGANLAADKQKIATDVWGDPEANMIMRFWESTLPTINFPACAFFDKFVLDTSSYEEQMTGLEAMASAAWAEYKAK